MKRMGLPCKHIFKVRSFLNLPSFDKRTARERWTMDHYKTRKELNSSNRSTDKFNDSMLCDDEYGNSHVLLSVTKEKEGKVLSQAQKFRKGLHAGQLLASFASEGGMTTFRKRYQLLKDIIKHWEAGTEEDLCPVVKCADNLKSTQPAAVQQDNHEDFQKDDDFSKVKNARPDTPEQSDPKNALQESFATEISHEDKIQSQDHWKPDRKSK